MQLTQNDKAILKSFGCPDGDMRQIGEALTKTRYSLYTKATGKEKTISRTTARELLGDEQFLSGLGRSAFHWSSSRSVDETTSVFFDSSNLFKN